MTGVELPFGAIHARGHPLPPPSFRSPQEAIELLGQGDPTLLAADAPRGHGYASTKYRRGDQNSLATQLTTPASH